MKCGREDEKIGFLPTLHVADMRAGTAKMETTGGRRILCMRRLFLYAALECSSGKQLVFPSAPYYNEGQDVGSAHTLGAASREDGK